MKFVQKGYTFKKRSKNYWGDFESINSKFISLDNGKIIELTVWQNNLPEEDEYNEKHTVKLLVPHTLTHSKYILVSWKSFTFLFGRVAKNYDPIKRKVFNEYYPAQELGKKETQFWFYQNLANFHKLQIVGRWTGYDNDISVKLLEEHDNWKEQEDKEEHVNSL